MTDFPSGVEIWSARVLGALAGASISLAYLLPRNRQDAALRFLTGVASGLMFGGPTGLWIAGKLDLTAGITISERMLAGSAVASLCAWWTLGALSRIATRWGPGPGRR